MRFFLSVFGDLGVVPYVSTTRCICGACRYPNVQLDEMKEVVKFIMGKIYALVYEEGIVSVDALFDASLLFFGEGAIAEESESYHFEFLNACLETLVDHAIIAHHIDGSQAYFSVPSQGQA